MVSFVLWMWPARLLVRLFLGLLLAGVPARGQSSSDRTIYDNDCVMDARFYACASNSVDLLSQSVIPFQLSLDPPGSTCGTPDETYCTLVSKFNVLFKPLIAGPYYIPFLTLNTSFFKMLIVKRYVNQPDR